MQRGCYTPPNVPGKTVDRKACSVLMGKRLKIVGFSVNDFRVF